jgi:cytoplasmic iron level regulating protein YaaA (DUF328/UPF0246 family)
VPNVLKSEETSLSPEPSGSMSSKQKCGRGIMMILSPAKTLDLSPYVGNVQKLTHADCDLDRTAEVAKSLKKRKDLKQLLGVSENIANTALKYWEAFTIEDSKRNSESKPCIYAFSGAAYQALRIQDCSQEAVDYLQRNLRIIDPVYGILRPLDQIQPYRLEMATKNVLPNVAKLADFWKESVTRRLSGEIGLRATPILLNLASDEYSAAVAPDELPENIHYVKVIFREDGRVISVHAKRARGLMVQFLAENNIQTMEGVKSFDQEGYGFVVAYSDDTTLVFERSKGTHKRPAPSIASSKAKKAR